MSIKTGLEYVGYIDPWTDEERLSDEEIVRCMDCKHYTDHSINLRPHWCRKHGSYHISPDGFCKWGERKDTRIKPCPFCGSTTAPQVTRCWDEKRECYMEHQLQVICNFNNNGCGASSGVRGSEVEAIAAWNRRAGE
jgi:hypothetical protein